MNNNRGQVLAGVLVIMTILLILTPHIITRIQNESRWTVKEQKSSTAFNLANGAAERGMWKLKSSTSTWAQAINGTVIAGYNFDVTYQDLEGGTYRIKFSSGPAAYQVTVKAEARDVNQREVRALQVVYENNSIPGPILTGGNLGLSGVFEPHWGPVMAQGNITISGTAASLSYPRKFSKNVVTGTATYPRDTNGPTPPNTDNLEWWSSYPVPDLPMLDFVTMRASATANGTLNYYNGFASSHTYTGYSGAGHTCNIAGTNTTHASPHSNHFADSNHHPLSKQNRIWYWDGDVVFTGGNYGTGHGSGLYGTIIVRGNMTLEVGDDYSYTASVPSTAWMEYKKIDTSAVNQYPADAGDRTNSATFNLGSQSWTGGPPVSNTDVGFRGLLYVGGNLTIASGGRSDFAGAIWVAGNVTNNNTGEYSLVFYDATIGAQVPVVNVILVQKTWKEITPSSTAWAP